MEKPTEAFPLAWPHGRKRTERYRRESARFDMSFARAHDEISRQIHLLAGKYPDPAIVISTNIALRRDGLPLANQREPEDVGVAVYFTYKKRQVCFACDRWNKIADNMQAIAKTIDALRGVARWGTGDMLEAAFTGFTALPAPNQPRGWRDVLGAAGLRDLDSVRAAYRLAASAAHPDRAGGSHERMAAINAAWESAQKELGQ